MDARLEIRLDAELKKKLWGEAERTGVKPSEYARLAIEQKVDGMLSPQIFVGGSEALEAALEERSRRAGARSSPQPDTEAIASSSASPRAPEPEPEALAREAGESDAAEIQPSPRAPEGSEVKPYRCKAHAEFSTDAPGARCWCGRKVVAV